MFLRLTQTATAALMIAVASPVAADGHVSADTVVATVNGTDITLGHMIVLRSRLPAQYQQLPAETLFDGILDQLVQQTLLGQTLDTLSKGSLMTIENEERALKASEVIAEISAEAVTDEALQAAYDARFEGVEPGQEYNASHILVETEEEAMALIEELNGGADFATLAQEKSTGPSGPNGGQLGWFGTGAMVKPFEDAVVSMEVGAVSAPVQTQFGWHVIKLNESRAQALPTLDMLRGELADEIQRAAIEARIEALQADADVTRSTTENIDPALLNDISLLEN